jgi:hypothetical protein
MKSPRLLVRQKEEQLSKARMTESVSNTKGPLVLEVDARAKNLSKE